MDMKIELYCKITNPSFNLYKAYCKKNSGFDLGQDQGNLYRPRGWQARLNPFTIYMAKRFGGSYERHQNSLELISMMEKDLQRLKKTELFFKAYYYCIGKIK
jgi:hypothetical protein